jgi:very-short-patch-repair endonuclease
MWALLRPFRQNGVHFRRQVQIGSYYADFACHKPQVVIEMDGQTHGTEIARSNDEVRDDYFRSRGYRVLRFWNGDVFANPEGVAVAVAALLTEAAPIASPPTLAALGAFGSSSATLPADGGGDASRTAPRSRRP